MSYIHIDTDKPSMAIQAKVISINMTNQFASELKTALWKSLTIESTVRDRISNCKFSDTEKKRIIELMDRLEKVGNVSVYTTTEQTELNNKVNAKYC